MSSANSDPLLKFISGYGSPEPPQSIEEIQGDFQLAGLSTLLKSYLSRNPSSKILDIGCGNGVLMAKLTEINAFKEYPKLEYFGFDYPDLLDGAYGTAKKLGILPRIKLIPFENKWTEYATSPCIIITRNVFHELKISEAAKLIYEICMFLPADSVIFLQDMTTLPVAEKGRCGWLGKHLSKILEKGGIKTNHIPDTSKRGVDVFLIEGQRDAKCELTEKKFYELLIQARKEQLRILKSEFDAMEEKPENKFPLLRLHHDIGAISIALQEFGEMAGSESEKNNEKTLASTFALAFSSLSELDIDNLRNKFKYPELKYFQNRSHSIDELNDFFRSDKTIFIVTGGPLIGKKTVVWWALSKKQHNRLPLLVNLTTGTDIIRIMEELAVQLNIGSFLDVEVLVSLRSLPTTQLRNVISEAIMRLASETILILDGFEDVIDPSGKIDNEEVAWLINTWSSYHKAKVIIESRIKVDQQLPLERCQFEGLSTFKSRYDGKYGEYLYTVHLLEGLVPIDYLSSSSEFGGFQLDLLKALDNHPYLIYVAGIIIRNNQDKSCLKDNVFIDNLKSKIYKNFLSSLGLNVTEKEIIYSLTLVKEPFPLKFISMATENPTIAKNLLEKGLLIESSPEHYRPLEILHQLRTEINSDVRNQIEKKWHLIFAKVFERMYAVASDPSYFRQAYYHRVLSGERIFITYHLAEISACADSWYASKKYSDALWAYIKLKEKRKLHPREQMKMASCFIRGGGLKEGRELYYDLFGRFEDWIGAKSSYVDSLLNLGSHAESALNMLFKIPEKDREYYWHLQAARSYRQLSKRENANEEFEEAIIKSPTYKTWPTIQEYITYAREAGDDKKEAQWLKYAWDDLKLHTNEIKIYLGAFLERTDDLDSAERILFEVYQVEASNSYCILPLIKTLCRKGKIEEAKDILEKPQNTPQPYDIFVYARIFYLKTIRRFSDCEEQLLALARTEKDRTSIHRWGQWADLFLSWCQTLKGREKIETAKRGLKLVKETIEQKNVPAMMACLELSRITGNTELQEILEKTIHEVNPSYIF